MSEWLLNQSWGLPVLAAFLAVVLVFEIRKAIKAFKEKKRFELGMAVVFAVVAGLALFVLFYF
ncbi:MULTISPECIES: hypothetical protein [Paenibacillus]|uniref:Membrane-anchored protein n=1 Tax=Paenibacillus lactis TaxID=228574 RepID=A0ABS4FIJ5_9BACL|nr:MULTISPECIES: hypothetical protein [Paenibacillus]MBP1896062.1 putative membrane-anchored protein [Paenibacillus lactis]MCM3495518.1 hypothetical protein [Paenibacillus lactis]GIO90459.1 hypothetical protein J31TS3_16860 [Paenibacillus lactis]HAG00734.1 hypothetical protein [Paenibacillus lactis]